VDFLDRFSENTQRDFHENPSGGSLKIKIKLNYITIQSVPRSKDSVSVIKTNQLMLYREIIAVCSQIHTKHIHILCGQNVQWLNVKLVVQRVTTGL